MQQMIGFSYRSGLHSEEATHLENSLSENINKVLVSRLFSWLMFNYFGFCVILLPVDLLLNVEQRLLMCGLEKCGLWYDLTPRINGYLIE